MGYSSRLRNYAHVQSIAKETMEFLNDFIRIGVSALEIKIAAEAFMKDKGADSFWYHGIGAFVLVGEQTTISISGKDYQASNLKVGINDLVTVDLSPEIDGFWGDLARSFAIQDGVVKDASQSMFPEVVSGIDMEIELHDNLKQLIGPDTTFHDVYLSMNSQIYAAEYENLDFKRNMGHSIARHIDERKYIEFGNNARLSDIGLFTFEPHIKKKDGKYGFKHENIYYFEHGKLHVL